MGRKKPAVSVGGEEDGLAACGQPRCSSDLLAVMAGAGSEGQYKELDAQIESLMKCTPLPEAEVKVLCDKAREILQASVDAHKNPQRAGSQIKTQN